MFAFCSICGADINIAHGGVNGIKVHLRAKKHESALNRKRTSANIANFWWANIGTFFKSFVEDDNSVINAECLFTSFIIKHNLTIAVADHAGPCPLQEV